MFRCQWNTRQTERILICDDNKDTDGCSWQVFFPDKLGHYFFEADAITTIALYTKDLIKLRATCLEIENEACRMAIENYGAMFADYLDSKYELAKPEIICDHLTLFDDESIGKMKGKLPLVLCYYLYRTQEIACRIPAEHQQRMLHQLSDLTAKLGLTEVYKKLIQPEFFDCLCEWLPTVVVEIISLYAPLDERIVVRRLLTGPEFHKLVY